MSKLIILGLLGLIAWVVWRWSATRSQPRFPPLALAADDPLMLEARAQARESIPQMLELFKTAPEHTRVKLAFQTNGGETEHLWADLLGVEGSKIQVRYLTPPVSHRGKLERLHTHELTDIEDWIVAKDPERYIGGYTMRVMFKRGREKWGDLPPELKEEEAHYR
jgi:uncharacterized protein YegJ (DUF2314 family)